MTIISVKCKHCGNNMTFETQSKSISCPFCGSQYKISELLNQNDINFLDKMKPAEIEKKIEANDHLKNGEAFLYKAEYVSAEKEFKKAIECDKDNYHGYFGVIRAKTHNLTILPDGQDLDYFSKSALKVVDNDDYEYLKNELNKLDLLKKEREQQKKQLEEQKKIAYKREKNKQKRSNLWTSLICAAVFAITIIALIVVVTNDQKEKDRLAQQRSTVEITTAAELSNFAEKPEYLSATIILKNDIDFAGGLWTPVGTAAAPFTGKFYGNNYTISNINIVDTDHQDENYLGFFGFSKGATITGLKLSNAKISTTTLNSNSEVNYAGLIVARANESNISLCEVLSTSQIVIKNKSKSTMIVGGVVGYAKDSKISNCLSHADITANSTNAEFEKNADSLNYVIGGVVGKLNNSGVSYSYSLANLEMSISEKPDQPDQINIFAGGVVGSAENCNDKFFVNFCYFTGKIDAKLEAVKSYSKIGGVIANFENNPNMISNFALFNDDSFKFNETSLSVTELTDNSILTIDSLEEEIIKLITANFSNEIWQNTDTLKPSLKQTTKTQKED